jgi:hypothetical protein
MSRLDATCRAPPLYSSVSTRSNDAEVVTSGRSLGLSLPGGVRLVTWGVSEWLHEGWQIGYMGGGRLVTWGVSDWLHTGCHQLNGVSIPQNNVVKSCQPCLSLAWLHRRCGTAGFTLAQNPYSALFMSLQNVPIV